MFPFQEWELIHNYPNMVPICMIPTLYQFSTENSLLNIINIESLLNSDRYVDSWICRFIINPLTIL